MTAMQQADGSVVDVSSTNQADAVLATYRGTLRHYHAVLLGPAIQAQQAVSEATRVYEAYRAAIEIRNSIAETEHRHELATAIGEALDPTAS